MALPASTEYILQQLRKHCSCSQTVWDEIEREADEKGFANLSKSAREQVRLAKVAWQAAHRSAVRGRN